MTQSPRHGDAAPVDAASGQPARAGTGQTAGTSNGHGQHTPWSATGAGATASNGGRSGASAGSATAADERPVEKLPRPDTPTDTVPVVRDVGGTATPAVVPDQGARTAGGSPVQAPGSRSAEQSTTARRSRARGPRRAKLQLRHINPWTVLKFSCVLAVALFFVWLIVVGVLYGILDAAGVINRLNDAYLTLKSDGGSAPLTAGTVFGAAALIGLVDIVLFVALTTVGSVVYNLCADLVGGIEVTLSER